MARLSAGLAGVSCLIIDAGRGSGASGFNPGPCLSSSPLFWPLFLSLLLHFAFLYSAFSGRPERNVAGLLGSGAITLHFSQGASEAKERRAFTAGTEHVSKASDGRSAVGAVRFDAGESVAKASIAPIAAQSEFELDESAAVRYLPRNLLDLPPVAMDEPDFEALSTDMPPRLELVLLIEASGAVGRVVEPAGVSSELSARLRRVFAPVRFAPGMLGGQPVPSRIRIELTRDETYVPVVVPVTAGGSGRVGNPLP